MGKSKSSHSGRKRQRTKSKKSYNQKGHEIDPITGFFLALKTHKIKLLGLLIQLLAGVFFAIAFVTLHLWGVRYEYILQMVSPHILDYIPIMVCFTVICVFTSILELLKRMLKDQKRSYLFYIIYSLVYSFIFCWILQINLFSFGMLFSFALIYSAIYLKVIRPYYLIDNRKLAERALNYKNQKYKIWVKLIEYSFLILHVAVIAVIIGNIYSIIPTFHFTNEDHSQIVVYTIKDKALISNFSIEKTKGDVRYIVLDRDSMRLGNLSTENFTLGTEKLFISGDIIN